MNTIRKSANEYLPRWFGSVLFFFLGASTAFGAAATANFEQEWSKLITAAQQEGTLSIASGGAPSRQYRPVVDAFSKKFNIKVEVSTGNATDTVNRVLAERKGRQVYRRRGVDQLARKSAALGAIRLVGAAAATAISSRSHRHVEVVRGRAYVRRQVQQVYFDLPRRFRGPV